MKNDNYFSSQFLMKAGKPHALKKSELLTVQALIGKTQKINK